MNIAIRSRRLVAGLAVVAAVAATTTVEAAASSRKNAHSNPILIGNIGPYSGPAASQSAAVPGVLNAWAASVNASGGINGRKVKIITDDTGTAATGADVTDAQQLIADHVTAIISTDSSDVGWVKLAAAANVPVLDAISSAGIFLTTDEFPVLQSPAGIMYGLVAAAKTVGPKMAIAYTTAFPGNAAYLGVAIPLGKIIHEQVPVLSGFADATPDFTSFCQGIKSTHSTSYLLAFEQGTATKISNQCYSEGVHVPRILIGDTAFPGMKKTQADQGAVAADEVAPWFDNADPAIAAFRHALRKYDPKVPGSYLDNSLNAWVWAAAEMTQLGLQRVRGHITPLALRNALYTVKNETLGGLIAPVTFSRKANIPNECSFLWTIKNHKFALTSHGLTPICAPRSAVEATLRADAKAVGGKVGG